MYRFLLNFCPKEFREEYGSEMATLFRDRCRREGALRVWLEVLPDLIITALREHMHTLIQDVGYTFRTLIKTPAYAAAALISLALGIGANTAIFSVVSGVLLDPLPYRDPERLMRVYEKRPKQGRLRNPVSAPDYQDWKSQNTVFEDMAGISGALFTLTGVGDPELVRMATVTPNFFQLLGVTPRYGRDFVAEEAIAGKNQVLLLSHGFWTRRFGADPGIIGRTVTLSDRPVTVIGVLPKMGDLLPAGADGWMPLVLTSRFPRAAHFMEVIARVKPGVSLAQARVEMDTIGARLEQAHPNENTGHSVNVFTLVEETTGSVSTPLTVLLGAVGLVLLVACANVANLSLARTGQRRREISIRRALGAGAGRLVRQLLTESVILSAIGGTLGMAIAYWGVRLFVQAGPGNLPRLQNISINQQVLFFTAAISILTGILVGLAPALFAVKTRLADTLKESGRGTTGDVVRSRARGLLVVAEVALALLLTVGGGLLMQSFYKLANVNPGFDAHNTMAVELALTGSQNAKPGVKAAFFDDYLTRVRALPGVISAGATTALPLSGRDGGYNFLIEGRPEPAYSQQPNGRFRCVTPGYFETMKIALRSGRFIESRDNKPAPPVVVINETMARNYWPDENPVGKRLTFSDEKVWREIIGVVGDVKHYTLDGETRPEFYFPFSQVEDNAMTVVVRTATPPERLAGALRAEVANINKNQPISSLRTVDQVLSTSLAQPRLYSVLLAIFSAVAMALAAVGIYGVMSFAVGQRVHEIGVRMALGAGANSVLVMVLKQGLALAAAGVVLGIGGALALTRVLNKLLFGVTATDAITFIGAALLLIGVAAAACYVPARRATRVDPVIALRCE